jgi:hypothetical protein
VSWVLWLFFLNLCVFISAAGPSNLCGGSVKRSAVQGLKAFGFFRRFDPAIASLDGVDRIQPLYLE